MRVQAGRREAMLLMRKYGFTVGLLAVVGLVVADPTGTVAAAGQWLGRWRGAQGCVMAMFLLSGLGLDASRARRGVSDVSTLWVSLGVIFLAAPALAWLHGYLPLERGLWIGLVLISVMPTTLSSGVVMADLAGGNPASALVVTLVASGLAIFTIPPSLELLLGAGGQVAQGVIDKGALAVRLGVLVLTPLALGAGLRRLVTGAGHRVSPRLGRYGQWLVLVVVWIAVSRSRETLHQAPLVAALSVPLALSFHGFLLLAAAGAARLAGLGAGRQEVVWFMGAQKTLPIAVLLQTALFPAYGSALVFCVVHHIVHLALDGLLAARLHSRGSGTSEDRKIAPTE